MVNKTTHKKQSNRGIVVRNPSGAGFLETLRQNIANIRLPDFLRRMNFDKFARRLGWISLGLGVMEILLPRVIVRWLGLRKKRSFIVRLLGFREVIHAASMFMRARPHRGARWRVAGDVLDLGLLAAGFTARRARKASLTIAAASVLGITALDVLTAVQLRRKSEEEKSASVLTQKELRGRSHDGHFQVNKSITINHSPTELYQFWRNFENLPRFMQHLKEVKVLNEHHSYWIAKAPAGTQVAWDARITEDRPDELIAWESMPDADVHNRGIVTFEPKANGRGTVVRVKIEYDPPGGRIGRAVAQLFGEEPGQQVAGDLKRFKQVIETGEVMRSDASPDGFGQKIQRPAQPARGGRKDFKPPVPVKQQKTLPTP